MTALRKIALGLAAGGFVFLTLAGNIASGTTGATASQSDPLEATDRHKAVSRLVTKFIERNHYSGPRVDDDLSANILDRYLESLDSNKMFFFADDVESFQQFRFELDDAVSSGSLDPVFEIFKIYKTRNEDRLNFSLEILAAEPDFDIEESYQFDRSEMPWISDPAEMDELWRKRVKNDALRLVLTGKTWDETRETLEKRYRRAQKGIAQIESDDVFESFMNAYAQTIDPHSSYLLPRTSEEYRIQMSLSYEGIGASLQTDEDYVVVMNIIPGGPAAIDGSIEPNDRITGVGQNYDEIVDVIGWRLDDVVQLIRGPGGSTVRLQILPAGAAPGSPEKVVELVRDKIKLEAQAAQKDIVTVPRGDNELRIGVISVPSFYQDFNARINGDRDYTSTTRDVRRLIKELEAENIDGLVMDLRNNGGGHLTEAQELSGLFIENGPVVQVRQSNGRVEILEDPDAEEVYKGPLAVLVNRYSASASEIFAAAIQDYNRGVILGQQTFGKGSVQNLYSLDRYFPRASDPGLGQLTLTIGKFYRIDGGSTQHRGVSPDISMPSVVDATVVGESTRESALPWDSIASTSFDAEPELDQTIGVVSENHDVRALNDPDFDFLIGDIAAFEDIRSQTHISLNKATREREQEEQSAERLLRENERRAAHGLEPLASAEEIDSEDAEDYLLEEAAEIVADIISVEEIHTVKLNQPVESMN